MGEGVGEEARLASGEPGEGDGGRGVIGAEVLEPEADSGGVALELAVTAGLASDEAGDEETEGGGVEEEDEGPKLGGVLPVLEGVEVALGCAGAGSFAAPPSGGEVVGHGSLPSVSRPPGRGKGRPYGCMVGRAGERWKGEVAVGRAASWRECFQAAELGRAARRPMQRKQRSKLADREAATSGRQPAFQSMANSIMREV